MAIRLLVCAAMAVLLSACSMGDSPNRALWKAVRRHDAQGVKDALARGAKAEDIQEGPEPAHLLLQPIHQEAAFGRNAEIIKQLLAAGAKVDAKVLDGRQPLHFAARSGSVEVVKELLAAGAPLETAAGDQKRTPLIEAAGRGQTEIVRVLLAAGAKCDAVDKDGLQPIHYAAGSLMSANDRHQILEMLLSAGAKVDALDPLGCQPIHYAAEQSMSVDAVQMLLARGAKVDAATKEGVQPIHKAAWAAQIDVIKALLAAGAKADATSTDGTTPVGWARQNPYTDESKMRWIEENLK